jgi:hypothetical protein
MRFTWTSSVINEIDIRVIRDRDFEANNQRTCLPVTVWRVPKAAEAATNGSGEAGERCPSPRRQSPPSGLGTAAKRLLREWTREHESWLQTSHGGPRFDAHWNGASMGNFVSC